MTSCRNRSQPVDQDRRDVVRGFLVREVPDTINLDPAVLPDCQVARVGDQLSWDDRVGRAMELEDRNVEPDIDSSGEPPTVGAEQ